MSTTAGSNPSPPAALAGTITIGGDLTVNRFGFGAMRITGPRILGEPKDPDEARRVLRRAVDLGVGLIDTADSYGPNVSERVRGTPTYVFTFRVQGSAATRTFEREPSELGTRFTNRSNQLRTSPA